MLAQTRSEVRGLQRARAGQVDGIEHPGAEQGVALGEDRRHRTGVDGMRTSRRFPDLELVTSDEPSYRPANFVSGWESLPVGRAH